MPGLTDTAGRFRHVFDIYWPVGVAVVVLVVGTLLVVAVRFRSDARDFPGGRHEWPAAEGAWALAVAAVVAVLLVVTFRTMDQERDALATAGTGPAVVPAGALAIGVRAAQWSWRFDYPGGRAVFGDARHNPTLVVPAGRPVHFAITSADVVHAFWIAERKLKVDAFPKRTTIANLVWPEPGYWPQDGRCNQFCGLDHATMNFSVRALPAAQFDAWLARR